jgi:HEAT repeat protein
MAALTSEHLPQMVAALSCHDAPMLLEAVTQFRKLLSLEVNPPIAEVIAAGVVPRLVQFLTHEQFPQLQFEAAWALTNIASGPSEQARTVIEAGAVPVFVQLMRSPADELREQAAWALGNLAGDSPQFRDYVLQQGAMPALLQAVVESSKLSLLRNATWAISNLCRGKPAPSYEIVSLALPVLARLLYSTDDEVLTDACWALSYLSDGPNERIQAVIDIGVCRRLVELLLYVCLSVCLSVCPTDGSLGCFGCI